MPPPTPLLACCAAGVGLCALYYRWMVELETAKSVQAEEQHLVTNYQSITSDYPAEVNRNGAGLTV